MALHAAVRAVIEVAGLRPVALAAEGHDLAVADAPPIREVELRIIRGSMATPAGEAGSHTVFDDEGLVELRQRLSDGPTRRRQPGERMTGGAADRDGTT
jgi:hypothetical protein